MPPSGPWPCGHLTKEYDAATEEYNRLDDELDKAIAAGQSEKARTLYTSMKDAQIHRMKIMEAYVKCGEEYYGISPPPTSPPAQPPPTRTIERPNTGSPPQTTAGPQYVPKDTDPDVDLKWPSRMPTGGKPIQVDPDAVYPTAPPQVSSAFTAYIDGQRKLNLKLDDLYRRLQMSFRGKDTITIWDPANQQLEYNTLFDQIVQTKLDIVQYVLDNRNFAGKDLQGLINNHDNLMWRLHNGEDPYLLDYLLQDNMNDIVDNFAGGQSRALDSHEHDWEDTMWGLAGQAMNGGSSLWGPYAALQTVGTDLSNISLARSLDQMPSAGESPPGVETPADGGTSAPGGPVDEGPTPPTGAEEDTVIIESPFLNDDAAVAAANEDVQAAQTNLRRAQSAYEKLFSNYILQSPFVRRTPVRWTGASLTAGERWDMMLNFCKAAVHDAQLELALAQEKLQQAIVQAEEGVFSTGTQGPSKPTPPPVNPSPQPAVANNFRNAQTEPSRTATTQPSQTAIGTETPQARPPPPPDEGGPGAGGPPAGSDTYVAPPTIAPVTKPPSRRKWLYIVGALVLIGAVGGAAIVLPSQFLPGVSPLGTAATSTSTSSTSTTPTGSGGSIVNGMTSYYLQVTMIHGSASTFSATWQNSYSCGEFGPNSTALALGFVEADWVVGGTTGSECNSQSLFSAVVSVNFTGSYQGSTFSAICTDSFGFGSFALPASKACTGSYSNGVFVIDQFNGLGNFTSKSG